MTAAPDPVAPARSAVDVHAHLIPESVVKELERTPRSFPNVELHRSGGSWYFRFGQDDPSPVPPVQIFELETRAEWLTSQRLTQQIVSPWTDLFGYGLPASQAADWCRLMNDALVDATGGRDELACLAMIPLQNTSLALEELQRTARAGCCGAMIGTSAAGRELDDPDLDELWSGAAELGTPIVIHPTSPGGDSRSWSGQWSNTVGRLREGLLALGRLLLAGVPLRHPRLRLVMALGGAGPESLLARLKRHAAVSPGSYDPAAGFRELYFDSLVLEPSLLRHLVELVGPERVLLGSDYPFPWEPTPRATVERAGLAAAEAAVLSTNARDLFRLRLPASEVVAA